MTLPSPFVNGVRDSNLITGATVIGASPAAMTVRYIITDEAQWSDGTPITGADFVYLWRGMTTTPGVIDPAAYRAISNVRVSGPAGKTVDVDFSQPVEDWQGLFSHLLPSHLLAADASDFATALSDSIPAAGGRFMLQSLDRGRGTITLNRNDRFWGTDPARVDIVSINTVQGTTQIADQLRSQQLSFVDTQPEETTWDVLNLLPDTQVRMVDGPRTLGLNLSVTSPLLEDVDARRELRSLIDVPLLARLAAGRSTDLAVADHEPVSDKDPVALREQTRESRPLRIGANASDPEASALARSLVDLLGQRGVNAQVVSTDTYSLAATDLPDGLVDAAVMWDSGKNDANAFASRIMCSPDDFRAGNPSGLCTPETDKLADEILSGTVSPNGAQAEVDKFLFDEAVWVPVLHERRILAFGGGIVTPDPDVAAWPDGLASAAQWRVAERTDDSGEPDEE